MNLNRWFRCSFVVSTLLFAGVALAQPGQMPMTDLGRNPIFGKLFGSIKGFTAQVETVVKTSKDTVSMPMSMAMLDGKTRMEIDMEKVKSKDLTPEAAGMMKQMGLNRMVLVALPDQKVARQIFPGLEGYVENSLATAAGAGSEIKVETKELGKETVDGHPCVKNLVTVVEADGRRVEATTWNATDLSQFPVKLEMPGKDGQVTMSFKEIKLTAPDAAQFAPPAGYSKHADMQQMMMSVMQKRFGK